MLVSRRLILMSALPLRQIPDLKTSAAADEGDFALQADPLAGFFGQNEPALAVSRAVLRARVQLAKKTRRSRGVTLPSFSIAALIRENSSGGMTSKN